jgi:hypothetical protein
MKISKKQTLSLAKNIPIKNGEYGAIVWQFDCFSSFRFSSRKTEKPKGRPGTIIGRRKERIERTATGENDSFSRHRRRLSISSLITQQNDQLAVSTVIIFILLLY